MFITLDFYAMFVTHKAPRKYRKREDRMQKKNTNSDMRTHINSENHPHHHENAFQVLL